MTRGNLHRRMCERLLLYLSRRTSPLDPKYLTKMIGVEIKKPTQMNRFFYFKIDILTFPSLE